MKKDDFVISNTFDEKKWYISVKNMAQTYLFDNLTMQDWYIPDQDWRNIHGYYLSKQGAEETLNKFLETKMLKIGDKVKILAGHYAVSGDNWNCRNGKIGKITHIGKEDNLNYDVIFSDKISHSFSVYELEKVNVLPTQEEIIKAAQTSDEAALEISIRKWEVLSEMSDEELDEVKSSNRDIVKAHFCGLCQRAKVTVQNWCRKKCPLGTNIVGKCCDEWQVANDKFYAYTKNWSEFRKAAKILTERLETELQKERTKMGTKDNGIKERLEQNRIDTERLLEEKAKLEKQLEESKKKPLRHGDYGVTNIGSPRLVIKFGSSGILHYACELECWENLTLNGVSGRLDEKGAKILGNIFDDLENKKGGM